MRVLLIWFELPKRPELLDPFVKIAENGNVEFIHLIHNTLTDRKEILSPFKMIYWFDYKTPFHLLNDIKPDKIVSELLIDLKGIALRIIAAKLKIPFIGMTHGIFFKNTADIVIKNDNNISSFKKYRAYAKISLFYFSVFSLFDFNKTISLIKLFFVFIFKGYYHAARTVKFSERNPDIYIIFQRKNALRYLNTISNIDEEKLIPIGVPMFDDIFNYLKNPTEPDGKKYYLMIDTAWIYQTMLPTEKVINDTYLKLAQFCKKNNAILKVKLHPYWYLKSDLPQHPSIEYCRNLTPLELNQLINKALGCFLYFSTLSIPLIVYKNCYCLGFKNLDEEISMWDKMNLIKTIDIETFVPDDIDFNKFEAKNSNHINQFITDYLFSVDGKAVERLQNIILE